MNDVSKRFSDLLFSRELSEAHDKLPDKGIWQLAHIIAIAGQHLPCPNNRIVCEAAHKIMASCRSEGSMGNGD